MPVVILLRHARQSRGMTGKLSQCYPADITTSLQFSNILCDGIIEAELALLDSLRKQRGREQFPHGTQIEDRVRRNSAILCAVGEAIVEERSLPIHPDRHRNASSHAVLGQYRLNLLPNDLFNIEILRGRVNKTDYDPDRRCNANVLQDHWRDSNERTASAQAFWACPGAEPPI